MSQRVAGRHACAVSMREKWRRLNPTSRGRGRRDSSFFGASRARRGGAWSQLSRRVGFASRRFEIDFTHSPAHARVRPNLLAAFRRRKPLLAPQTSGPGLGTAARTEHAWKEGPGKRGEGRNGNAIPNTHFAKLMYSNEEAELLGFIHSQRSGFAFMRAAL